jgi:rpsU-divergently transcribed protein
MSEAATCELQDAHRNMRQVAVINRVYCADTWPQAMALMAKPENAQSAYFLMLGLFTRLAKQIQPQGAPGDPPKFAKLFALYLIYSSTELYMLTDFSPGHSDTWQALDRRVDDFLRLRSGAQQVEQFVLEQVNKIVTFGRL